MPGPDLKYLLWQSGGLHIVTPALVPRGSRLHVLQKMEEYERQELF